MPDNECDEAFQKFCKLVEHIDLELSELDTRAKIIDPLFVNCLGWTEEDMVRETHVHKGFLDYVFKIDEIPRFILEAKKTERSFKIPRSFGHRYYRINGTITTDRNIKDAIEQAQRYCIEIGVNFGVISNGHQYVLFEAFKYGKPWRSGNCVVFKSLKEIKKNFTVFWNVLNKKAVENNSLRKFITQESLPSKFFRPIDSLQARDAEITRNNLSPFLLPFNSYVFEDIITEEQSDVLRSCYVTQKEYKRAGMQINRFFDKPPQFARRFNVEMFVETRTKAGRFQELYEKCEKFLRAKTPEGSIILLMGGIGAGKTTFIHHFFKFVVKNPKRTLWFYVNFLRASPNPDDIENHIYNSIMQEFEHKYQDKLKDELVSVGLDSIGANTRDITILFSILTLKGYTISLVLDNVDQHSYVSPEYQERTLLLAKYLTEKLKTITVVTLREESFFRSTMSGVLDAFRVPVFHISSPRFDKLIRYRIDYALKMIEQKYKGIKTRLKLGPSTDVVKMFFEITANSLRITRPMGDEIIRFIEDISGGNMRLALNFFTTFLLSGNTDVDEMLRIETRAREQGETGYQIPFHHVVKSIILANSRLYSSSRSMILNLFDIDSEHTNSHFLRLRILNYLYNRMSYEPRQGRGYVEIDTVIDEAERVGIARAAIADSLSKLALFGLVQFENQSKKGYKTASYVRITNTGIYYLTELVGKFIYLDLVWMDTPISRKDLVKKLTKLLVELRDKKTEYDLDRRFQRTRLFLEYLKKDEQRELESNPEYTGSDLTMHQYVLKIIESCEKEIDYIKHSREARATRY